MSVRNILIMALVFLLATTVAQINGISSFKTDISMQRSTKNNTISSTSTNVSLPIWAGFIGCLIASIFFGSNFVPVKHYSVGDGFFFQFVFCVAVWIVGLTVDLILDNERFYPLVMVGGVLWTTGNLVTVFCIKTCGLAVGLLIWGTTNLVMGWAGGRFGMFGIQSHVPSTTSKLLMNYASVILASFSAIFFILIKTSDASHKLDSHSQLNEQVVIELEPTKTTTTETVGLRNESDFPFLNRFSQPIQKIIGCLLAGLAGILYGIMFIPDQYIRDNPDLFERNGILPSNNGLYYVNSQFSGILLTSAFYFFIYTIVKRNKPVINPIVAAPAMISGVMWAIATVGFIVAISSLKSHIAYPIVTVLPGVVTSLWSLCWFREIVGKKNYLYLGCGMLIRCTAAVLSGLSA